MIGEQIRLKREGVKSRKKLSEELEKNKALAQECWMDIKKQHDLLIAIADADSSVRNLLNNGLEEDVKNYDFNLVESKAKNDPSLNKLFKPADRIKKENRKINITKAVLGVSLILIILLILLGATAETNYWSFLGAAFLLGIIFLAVDLIILFCIEPGVKKGNRERSRKIEKWDDSFRLVAARRHMTMQILMRS